VLLVDECECGASTNRVLADNSSSSVAGVSGARAGTLARWREAAMVDVRLRCAGRQLQGVTLRASAVG
jgi:hypothetical protein